MGLSWLKPAAGLLVGAVLLRAVFPQPNADWMMGTWVLVDEDNVPFNLILRPDGSSLTVTGKRHPNLGRPHRMASDQLLQRGSWQTWGNGIRSTYIDGWIDTIKWVQLERCSGRGNQAAGSPPRAQPCSSPAR